MALAGTTTTYKYRTDKTVAEIQAAYNAGKKVVIHFQDSREVDSEMMTIKYIGQAGYNIDEESNKSILTLPINLELYESESGYFENDTGR